jgi:glyoxalase family protein
MSVHSIHHVTAATAHIAANAEYYTKLLGLRLVKKSVNQDDVSAYHLFYADAVGTPGTDMTFFDWPTIGPNMPGPGTIALTSFRIPSASLDYWADRLEQAGSQPDRSVDSQYRERLLFGDPEGQRLELVGIDDRPTKATPWTSSVPEEHAIRGIVGVDLDSVRLSATRQVLTDVLGFQATDEDTYETEDDAHYGRIRLYSSGDRRLGRMGAGGVHHVAFRVANDEELLEKQAQIEALGLSTSGFVDRFYFHSLYFREPGGVLFELATDGPGFSADEDASTLGQRLALPPFLEGRRAEIEANLKPIQ